MEWAWVGRRDPPFPAQYSSVPPVQSPSPPFTALCSSVAPHSHPSIPIHSPVFRSIPSFKVLYSSGFPHSQASTFPVASFHSLVLPITSPFTAQYSLGSPHSQHTVPSILPIHSLVFPSNPLHSQRRVLQYPCLQSSTLQYPRFKALFSTHINSPGLSPPSSESSCASQFSTLQGLLLGCSRGRSSNFRATQLLLLEFSSQYFAEKQ